jgi:N-terminal acetyltransferase B complex non-catalytic subunit
MGEIFARQGKCDELIDLWNNPPAPLKDLMATHQANLRSLRIKLSRESGNWTLVESESLASIENAILQSTENPDSKALWELCSWNIDVWTGWLAALRINRPRDE